MSPVKIVENEEKPPILKPLAGQCRLLFKTSSSDGASCSNGACAMEVGIEKPSEFKPIADHNGNSAEDLMTMDTTEPAIVLPRGQLQIDSSGQLHKAPGKVNVMNWQVYRL